MLPLPSQAEIVQIATWEVIEPITSIPQGSQPKPPLNEYVGFALVLLMGFVTAAGDLSYKNASEVQSTSKNNKPWHQGQWSGDNFLLTFTSFSGSCQSELAGRSMVQELHNIEIYGDQVLFTVDDLPDPSGRITRPPRQYVFVMQTNDGDSAILYRLNPRYRYSFYSNMAVDGTQAMIPRIDGNMHTLVAAFHKAGTDN